MPVGLLRAVGAMALLPWLLLPPAVGQEHRHAPDDDHHEVVHRHFSAHHTSASDHEHHEVGATEDDDHVLWLNDAVLGGAEYRLPSVSSVTTATFVLARPQEPDARLLTYVSTPAHGPPRAITVLRGPPSPTLLS